MAHPFRYYGHRPADWYEGARCRGRARAKTPAKVAKQPHSRTFVKHVVGRAISVKGRVGAKLSFAELH